MMNAAMWLAWLGVAGLVGVYGWIWKKSGEKGRAWLEWGLVAGVAGVSAVSVALHEPWADELHAWLQAREMTVGELWREMHYEGHFLTWHLLLHPFARLGAPVETMGWISWALNAAAVAWFARKAPLGGWAKAAAGLSCLFLYVNPVISRCYVLAPLALWGMASLWGKRDERPVAFGLWTALLANTHVCMAGTAAAVFGVFAWENVWRRADGKGWKECGRQWAGLAVMAAGGALALAQIVPSLWESSVELGGDRQAAWSNATLFFAWCVSRAWVVLTLAGLAGLGILAWRRDRGVFWTCVATWLWMVGFSVFLYPARVPNRALAWWPAMIAGAWAMSGKKGQGQWAGLAVAAMGMGLARPDMTWTDWEGTYDPTRGACRYIESQYGRGAEVWIDGNNYLSEVSAVYLDNVWDWQTGRRAERVSWQAGRSRPPRTVLECREGLFAMHPEKEGMLAFMPLPAKTESELSVQDLQRAGLEPEYWVRNSWSGIGVLVARVRRGDIRERRDYWMRAGMERHGAGDREGAEAAWKRAVEEDAGAWEAMNNLAWVSLEDGRLEEARAWIDRAMESAVARENAGVRDTAAAVEKAERVAAVKSEGREQEDTKDGASPRAPE